ncbi:peptidyl-prolyl cis-trans isomerase Pin1-like [Dioscorea cayenensis subsp. rotundata]|uniref:Peptidyl-prolyl cis-trans isomerase n=1 Tax=Dioscorea cayennensis subsp. rotundata TaxID=55577 RepID=A0AB40APL2_DIOCR|nr:peptidyl-prolyl cis-trans isomerase Pin1-like [Dioscorea cayenensis subsp. rotundata]
MMASEQQVWASLILIKHEGSQRKTSWKDPDCRIISATTLDVAIPELCSLHDNITSGRTHFEEVASRHSHCSSAKSGGDLGALGRGQMQKPFDDATFSLKVGEISDIVDTDSGVHIILRTG